MFDRTHGRDKGGLGARTTSTGPQARAALRSNATDHYVTIDTLSTMNHSTMPISTLTPQQRKLRRKLKEDMAKILNRRPVFAQDRYAHMVANAGDWIIAEQAPRRLPLSLRQSLPLELRDLGESLLEETRTLNNRYVGLGFRTAEVMLTGDPEFLELHARTLAWGGEVAA